MTDSSATPLTSSETVLQRTLITLKDSGSTKNALIAHLFKNENDNFNLAFDVVLAENLLKKLEIDFRKKKGDTWRDRSVNLFNKNKSATSADMRIALKGSTKDDEYYVKTWFEIFSKIANPKSTLKYSKPE